MKGFPNNPPPLCNWFYERNLSHFILQMRKLANWNDQHEWGWNSDVVIVSSTHPQKLHFKFNEAANSRQRYGMIQFQSWEIQLMRERDRMCVCLGSAFLGFLWELDRRLRRHRERNAKDFQTVWRKIADRPSYFSSSSLFPKMCPQPQFSYSMFDSLYDWPAFI